MSILFPLMALGALAVGVPIWLHLRRRDESNLVEFSTLRFLEDQPLARARPMWPQNWPLLLLRIAALLFLVAAFTWPYVEGEETVIVEESRVYILDNTLSHQLDRGFQTARDSVADELAAGDMRTQIGVVEISATTRTLVRFGDDSKTAAEEIRQLEPSDARGRFPEAFRAASEMLETSLGARRRIVLLSDSQGNQWTLARRTAPFLDPEVEVELPTPIEEVPANLSLSDVRARRIVRDGDHWIEAGVVLKLQGEPENVDVVFRDRGAEVSRQEIRFDAGDQPPANTGVVLAEWKVDPEQWVLGEAVIERNQDVLSGDDRAVFSLPPLRAGRVELLSTSVFLRRALDPEVMIGRWEVTVTDTDDRVDRSGDQSPDIVCVDSERLTSSAVRTTIREDLSNGRGVMLMVGDANPLTAGFLRDLGIVLKDSASVSTDPETFRYVFAEHPIFSPFRRAEMGNLAEIDFTQYRRLEVRDAMPLAFSASGDPLVFEASVGPGRMLVFAFAFDRRDTNWPIHPTFIPFLDKSLQYLRGETITKSAYLPGESVIWELPPGASADRIVVSPLNPATGTAVDVAPEPIEATIRDRRASFTLPARAGHFQVRYGESETMSAVLDVNPSPLESELTFQSDPDSLRAWTRESSDAKNQTESNLQFELTRLEALQQPYWWYLMLAAAVAFLTESLIAAVVRA